MEKTRTSQLGSHRLDKELQEGPPNVVYCESEQWTAVLGQNSESETKKYIWLYGEKDAEITVNGEKRTIRCGPRVCTLVMSDIIDEELSPGWVWVYNDRVNERLNSRHIKQPDISDEYFATALEAARLANEADEARGRIICTVALVDPASEKELGGVTLQERL